MSKHVIGGLKVGDAIIRNNGVGIQIDGALAYSLLPGATEATITASEGALSPPAIVPGVGGYQSEVAQALVGRWTTDAEGRLLNADGSVHTLPENTDPIPAKWAGATFDEQMRSALQWQFDHPYYKHQFYIDGGNKFGQPGSEPGVYFARVGDALVLRADAPVPPPIPVTRIPETADAGQTRAVIEPPKYRQSITILGGDWTAELPHQKLGVDGHVRIVEVPPHADPTGEIVVSEDGREIYRADANGFGWNYSVGQAVQGATQVTPGSTLTVTGHGWCRFEYRSPS